MNQAALTKLDPLEEDIHFVRWQRVMLDSDLALLYGVPLKRLNQQVRRNKKRFPEDFCFQLTAQEAANLRLQVAPATLHGGRRTRPWAFTEHGAIMLATVLNTDVAAEASVRVVRAFVHMREMLASNKQLAAKFAELERRMDANDHAVKTLFDAIRELLEPQTDESRRKIGFQINERAGRYRTRMDL
jgi:hypothetical protein